MAKAGTHAWLVSSLRTAAMVALCGRDEIMFGTLTRKPLSRKATLQPLVLHTRPLLAAGEAEPIPNVTSPGDRTTSVAVVLPVKVMGLLPQPPLGLSVRTDGVEIVAEHVASMQARIITLSEPQVSAVGL